MKTLKEFITENLTDFTSTINTLTNDIDYRCKQASKDKRLKDLAFPTKDEIYESVSKLFNNVIPTVFKKATVASRLSNYNAPELKVIYTGKLSYQELEDMRPRTKTHILGAEEAKILDTEYFKDIKIKSDTGTVNIILSASGSWHIDRQNSNEIYMPLYMNLYSYRPNSAAMKLSKEL